MNGATQAAAPLLFDAKTVHTLIFDPRRFKRRAAEAWALGHGFASAEPVPTAKDYRLRVAHADAFYKGTFRTVDVAEGVRALVAEPKGV